MVGIVAPQIINRVKTICPGPTDRAAIGNGARGIGGSVGTVGATA